MPAPTKPSDLPAVAQKQERAKATRTEVVHPRVHQTRLLPACQGISDSERRQAGALSKERNFSGAELSVGRSATPLVGIWSLAEFLDHLQRRQIATMEDRSANIGRAQRITKAWRATKRRHTVSEPSMNSDRELKTCDFKSSMSCQQLDVSSFGHRGIKTMRSHLAPPDGQHTDAAVAQREGEPLLWQLLRRRRSRVYSRGRVLRRPSGGVVRRRGGGDGCGTGFRRYRCRVRLQIVLSQVAA